MTANWRRKSHLKDGASTFNRPKKWRKVTFSKLVFSKRSWLKHHTCSNLIGSESGQYFTILPANPGGIVDSFIDKFVGYLWTSKNRHFQTIFLLKLALLLASAREKWILLFRQKIWRENEANQPGKPLKESKISGSWCRFTSFITALKVPQSRFYAPFIGHFCSVCSFVFHFAVWI